MPCLRLQPYVKAYMYLQCSEACVNTVLPDTSMVLAFRVGGIVGDDSGILPSMAISGLRKTVRHIQYHAGAENILVVLQPGAMAAFFRADAHLLYNQSTSLEDFFSRQQLADVYEKIATLTTVQSRLAVIEELLLSSLSEAKSDTLVNTAIGKIYSTQGIGKIQQLADELYISKDAFEKRFRRVAGISAKQFATTVRMRSIVANIRKHSSLTSLAHDAEYYDQAHFNKAFKDFTSRTPGEFFAAPSFW